MADKQIPKKETANRQMHRKKRRFAFGRLNVLVTALAAAFIALFLLIAKRPEISELEKRKLAAFPDFSLKALFNGEFASGLHEWYVDTVPNRDGLQLVGADILALKGFHPEEGVIHGKIVPRTEETEYVPSTDPVTDPPVTEPVTDPVTEPETDAETLPEGETAPETEPSTEPATEPETEPETDPVIIPETEEPIDRDKIPDEDEGLKSGILVYKKRAIGFYYGNASWAGRYASAVEKYWNDLDGKVNVWSMTIPTPVAYYLPDKYAGYTNDEKTDIDVAAGKLVHAKNVDVYGALAKHKDEYIYFRTDHHWAPLGAYYAAQEFAKTAGVPFASLSQMQECVIPNYVGSMYMYTDYDPTLKKNPDEIIYHKPLNKYSCWYYDCGENNKYYDPYLQNPVPFSYFQSGNVTYCVFIGTDERAVHVTTDVKNGRKLMIIKDSYGNALAPYLFNSFEEIWVLDMRYLKVNPIKLIKENGITDLLFAANVVTFFGETEQHIEAIRGIPYTLNLPEQPAAELPPRNDGKGGEEE